jgi:hypothetical protein
MFRITPMFNTSLIKIATVAVSGIVASFSSPHAQAQTVPPVPAGYSAAQLTGTNIRFDRLLAENQDGDKLYWTVLLGSSPAPNSPQATKPKTTWTTRMQFLDQTPSHGNITSQSGSVGGVFGGSGQTGAWNGADPGTTTYQDPLLGSVNAPQGYKMIGASDKVNAAQLYVVGQTQYYRYDNSVTFSYLRGTRRGNTGYFDVTSQTTTGVTSSQVFARTVGQ